MAPCGTESIDLGQLLLVVVVGVGFPFDVVAGDVLDLQVIVVAAQVNVCGSGNSDEGPLLASGGRAGLFVLEWQEGYSSF